MGTPYRPTNPKMITLTFDFPTPEIEQLAVQELSDYYGYSELILADGAPAPNPQSRLDFATASLKAELGERVKSRIQAKRQIAVREQLDATFGQTVVESQIS